MATRIPVTASPTVCAPYLPLEPALARELAIALRSIRYGTIELVIHEGRSWKRREEVGFEQEHRGGR